MRVLILTEAGENIGYGHVSRCLSLHEEFLKKDHISKIIVRGKDIRQNTAIKNVYFQNWPENVTDDNDVVIIDSYNCDKKYYEDIIKYFSCVAFDDFNRIDYPKDCIIINPAGKKEDYKNNVLISGFEFFTLKSCFHIKEQKKINQNISRILLMPGSGISEESLLLILKELREDFEIDLVLSKPIDKIPENINTYKDISSKEIKRLMQKDDICITAAGQTLIEALSVGIPCITIKTAENQQNNIVLMIDKDLIINIGSPSFENINKIKEIVDKMDLIWRKEVSKRSLDLIDGKGSKRIIKAILRDVLYKNINIRKAESDDCKKVFDLANEKSVRENSYNSDLIIFEEHKIWYDKKIKDKDEIFLLGFYKDHLVGQVRFSKQEKNVIVGISISPQFRGMNAASLILSLGEKILKEEFKEIENIYAYVKNTNKASIGIFKKNGYDFNKDLEIEGTRSQLWIKRFNKDND
ncbi:MAG: hypothetical protein C0601_12940 [Candidatus Muiribacterium halophilum]|uniref:N-acetyltransferase domain-containing protein n=1 Tax=Muiribacterium halophilum TaxID=2053465 RepID=A0A2N5Z9Z6_MUIH1|nr:MAG: hypothetical protein C0601_12940 [Candidatus Muirbacterium halophilum]